MYPIPQKGKPLEIELVTSPGAWSFFSRYKVAIQKKVIKLNCKPGVLQVFARESCFVATRSSDFPHFPVEFRNMFMGQILLLFTASEWWCLSTISPHFEGLSLCLAVPPPTQRNSPHKHTTKNRSYKSRFGAVFLFQDVLCFPLRNPCSLRPAQTTRSCYSSGPRVPNFWPHWLLPWKSQERWWIGLMTPQNVWNPKPASNNRMHKFCPTQITQVWTWPAVLFIMFLCSFVYCPQWRFKSGIRFGGHTVSCEEVWFFWWSLLFVSPPHSISTGDYSKNFGFFLGSWCLFGGTFKPVLILEKSIFALFLLPVNLSTFPWPKTGAYSAVF